MPIARSALLALGSVMMMTVQAAAQSAQDAVRLEILGVTVDTTISGGNLGDAAKALDPATTRLVVLTVRFPRGRSYSTKDLTMAFSASGNARKVECAGYAPVRGGWMFVRGDRGMSSLEFTPGGDGTIDMRLLFALPKEVTRATFAFKGVDVGSAVTVPAERGSE